MHNVTVIYAENPIPPASLFRPIRSGVSLSFMREDGKLFCATVGHFKNATTGNPVEDCRWGWFHDGEWQWSEREIYHVKKYDLALDPEFVTRALAR
ncbi:hypothetical protein [Senegalimassilia anaerobia]|uniref:Uncharacterized protein n=1 Tax=Senegalimassilia anaerobia TaxID=1473216 RepID=A0A369LF83_9ACTN|nr:hypothetical protein [Senegalimassilia anaerobia]RDB57297.1 hypothetical protein C1880_00255 [Senegalimassilia anaerobia]